MMPVIAAGNHATTSKRQVVAGDRAAEVAGVAGEAGEAREAGVAGAVKVIQWQ